MNKIGAKDSNILLWIVIAVAALLLFGVIKLPGSGTKDVVPTGTGAGINFAADAAYATVDKFGTTVITGTTYYVDNGGIAQTTAPKLTKGNSYTYWVSNSTFYYTQPKTFTSSGTDNIVNNEAYKNGTVTITGYDVINNCNVNTDVTSNTCNISVAANAQSKVDFKYLGGAKTANLPFGGVMVVEYNNSIPTQTCAGDGIVGQNSKFQVTYSDSATSNTHKVYEVAAGFDVSKTAGATGVTNVIRCETVNGAVAGPAGGIMKLTFIPANYYLGNDGKIYLDVEQKMNGATTRTGFSNGFLSASFYTK